IQTRITDARRDRVLRAVGPTVGSISARSELVGRLGREVVAALAPLLDQDLGSWEPAVRPATFQAYQAYSEGLEAVLQDRPEKMVEAGRLFEQALAADSTFHSARLGAAQAYQVVGRAFEWSYYAKADSLIATLVESRAQLTRYERCRLDLVMAIGPRPDFSAAYEAARCMVEEEPGSEQAKRELAILTYRINRPAAAIEILGELDPDRGLMKHCNCYWPLQQNAYLMLGDYEGALEAGRQHIQRSPENLGWEIPGLAGLGRLDEVAANLEARRSLPGREARERLGGYLVAIANILHTHGHRDAARELFDEAIAWYRSRPDSVQPRAQLAFAFYMARRWDDALRLYEELAEENPENTGHRGMLGQLAARRGDRAEALRVSEELRSLEDRGGGYTLTRARIAALLGDHAEAMTLLQQAIDLGVMWGHGSWLLYDIDIQTLSDYPPFQEFLRPKG
ncbi:MAG: tetratricopeptide repeat protein, partial [Gemmatimonadota bacterium]